MTWYAAGTVAVTNNNPVVTLTTGVTTGNIFVDDGFIGPDGEIYPILTIDSASQFTLGKNYDGVTATGQPYMTLPSNQSAALRELLVSVNQLVIDYQDIANNAGQGKFESGDEAAPGVRGKDHTGTGLVWNPDGTLAVSVNGTIVGSFSGTGFQFLRSTDGDALIAGKTGGAILRIFASADTIGLFNAAGAGGGRDGLRIVNDAVAVDINANEIAKFGNDANPGLLISKNYGSAGHLLTAIRVTLNAGAGGAYMGGYNLEVNYGHNAEFVNGSNWIARHTFAARYTQQDGGHKWFGNTGLTTGAAFTPTERMCILPNGNVGIGVSAPAEKLHVGGNARIGFSGDPLTYNMTIAGRSPSGGTVDWDFKTNDATYGARTAFTVTAGGSIGIGILSPATKLEIYGGPSGTDTNIQVGNASTAFRLGVDSTNAVQLITYQNVPMIFFTNGNERMRMTGAGLLGIGTTNPQAKLDLRGDMWIRPATSSAYLHFHTANDKPTISFANQDHMIFQWNSVNEVARITTGSAASGATATPAQFRMDTTYANSATPSNQQLKIELAHISGTEAYGFTVDNIGRIWYHAGTSSSTAGGHVFATSGTNKMQINANGNVGVNCDPALKFEVKSSVEIARFTTTTVRGSGNGFVGLGDPSGRKGYWGYGGGNDVMYLINDISANLVFGTGAQSRLTLDISGNLTPVGDNTQAFGWSSARWSVIYAATGTINTSDERSKRWRGGLTKAELKAGIRVIDELGFFQWEDAISDPDKGEKKARFHFGVRAQQVWRIFAEEKLVSALNDRGKPGKTPYGFLCYDSWDVEKEEIMRDVEVAAIIDNDGNIVEEGRVDRIGTGKFEIIRQAGDSFGIRTDQLALFLIAVQGEIQKAQQAEIAAQAETIATMQEQIAALMKAA